MDAYFSAPEWSGYRAHVEARRAAAEQVSSRLATVEDAWAMIAESPRIPQLVGNKKTRVGQLEYAKSRGNALLALNILRAHHGLQPLDPFTHGRTATSHPPDPARYYRDMLDDKTLASLGIHRFSRAPDEQLEALFDAPSLSELREFFALPQHSETAKLEGVRRILDSLLTEGGTGHDPDRGTLTPSEKQHIQWKLDAYRWSISVFRDAGGKLAAHVDTRGSKTTARAHTEPGAIEREIHRTAPRLAVGRIFLNQPERLVELEISGRRVHEGTPGESMAWL